MNNVVVINPDDTIVIGNNTNTSSQHEENHVAINVIHVEFPNKKYIYICLCVDVMKLVFVYHLFFTLHLVLHFFSYVLCVEGLKCNSIQKVRQYGSFHLLESLVIIGMFFFERSYLLIIIVTVLIFDISCYIIVRNYTFQLQLALNNINS